MPEPLKRKYEALDAEIRRAGFFTNGIEPKGSWDRTTVCAHRLPGGAGFSGNSFWLTLLPCGYIVGTWGGLIYRVPDSERMASLCATWLTRYPDVVRTDFDEDIKQEFCMIPVSHDEFDNMIGATVEDE
jgi:hypothetical protein